MIQKLFSTSNLRKLYAYQLAALKWAIPRSRIALFLEMRLGKSIIALRWCHYKRLKKVLIVCPLSVIPSWERECTLEEKPYLIFRTQNQPVWDNLLNRFFKLDTVIYGITNYECVRLTKILDQQWDAIILDESTRIRKPDSQITNRLLSRTSHIKNRAILSGLPAPESLLDYFTQFKFLSGHFYGIDNFFRYRKRFFYLIDGGKWIPESGSKLKILKYVKFNSYTLKRSEVKIGSKKIYQIRHIELPDSVRKAYDVFERDWMLKAMVDATDSGEEVSTKWAMVARTYLHEIAGGYCKHLPSLHSDHKYDEILELLQGDLQSEQVVIWCHYRSEIAALFERLSYRYKIGELHGSTSIETRKSVMERFRAGDIQLVVAQTALAKFGLDLSSADTAIYYSNSWMAEDRFQSMERIIHPKKKSPVLIVDLVTKNTIDEDVLKALTEKRMRTNAELEKSIYEAFLNRTAGQTSSVVSSR